MLVNFTTVYPSTGDPAPVFGENAGNLVNIDLMQSCCMAETVNLSCCRKRLLRDYDSIKICIQRCTIAVG